ncbi:MAG: histidine ammonia-lyase [Phycisphaerales bacterium]
MSVPEPPLRLNGGPLDIESVVAVARRGRKVEIGEEALARLSRSRSVVDRRLETGEAIYGVNTGFGSLARTRIKPAEVREVQRNLLRSHAAGVGDRLPIDVVRAMNVLLVASLCRGHSGVRPIIAERVVDLLNHGITPVVPSRGSVGASGDLAPLAHSALVLIGEGRATRDGSEMSGAEALAAADLQPVVLDAKEGLALINGTHLMAAMATLALADLDHLTDAALAATALSIDACKATDAFLDPRVHDARTQPGQIEIARRLRELLAGSEIIDSHKENDPRVQDPYSLRCAPQVLGAALDLIDYAAGVVGQELGAVSDNPLVFDASDDTDDAILSAGNFHGLPLAIAMDALSIAVAHIAGVAERRVYYLLAASDSENPINVYLSPQPGLHSGMMIAQYTAAALCNEIQTLATPASVGNIPTSAGQEDYNSFGPTAGHQLQRSIELATRVVAIELLCAAEALEYHRPLRSGAGVERVHAVIREAVPRLTQDRPPAPDIEAVAALVREGRFSS